MEQPASRLKGSQSLAEEISGVISLGLIFSMLVIFWAIFATVMWLYSRYQDRQSRQNSRNRNTVNA